MAFENMSKFVMVLLYLTFGIVNNVRGGVLTPEQKQNIDNVIKSLMETAQIPGMGVAIVKDNEVEKTSAYGLADVYNNRPFTTKTKHYIASLTKHFTATMVAKIFEDKGVTMEQRIKPLLGERFHMPTPFITKHLNMRDVLSHRVAFNSDAIWSWTFHNVKSREETLERLRFFPQPYKFRTAYVYTDDMINVGGFAATVMTGRTVHQYEELMRQLFFMPLGMNSTLFHYEATAEEKETEFSIAYGIQNGTYRKVKWESFEGDRVFPAGTAIASTVEDMSKWLLFHTTKGRNSQGVLIVNETALEETYKAVTSYGLGDSSLQKPNFPVTYTKDRYALGWNNGFYRGYRMVQHGGSWNYMRSMLTLLPDQNIGVWTCTNAGNSQEWGAQQTTHMYVMDLLLNETPWLNITNAGNHLKALYQENVDNKVTKRSKSSERTSCANSCDPTRPLEVYAGAYGHFGFANLTINYNQTQNRLEGRYGDLGNYILTPLTGADQFNMIPQEPYWFQSPAQIDFYSSDGNTIDNLDVHLSWQKYNFKRDLKYSSAPPPPVDNCP